MWLQGAGGKGSIQGFEPSPAPRRLIGRSRRSAPLGTRSEKPQRGIGGKHVDLAPRFPALTKVGQIIESLFLGALFSHCTDADGGGGDEEGAVVRW